MNLFHSQLLSIFSHSQQCVEILATPLDTLKIILYTM